MRTPSPPLADSTAAPPPPASATTPGQAPTSSGRPKRSPKPTVPFSVQQAAPRRSPPGSQRRDSSRQTFTTALSYPEPTPQGTVYVAEEPEGELKRDQRKSKAQAISKLERLGTPLSIFGEAGGVGTTFVPQHSAAGPSGPGPSRNPLYRPVVENPPFDPATVRMETPGDAPSRSGTRLFGLEECPIFFPTMEEFRDPMKYVQSISEKGRQYGMVKIIPPGGWRMPFMLDTEKFRFKTRLQRLNSLEAASRAKLNFLEQLTLFHLQHGNKSAEIPVIDRRPVDLWKLRKEVNKVGGLAQVDRMKGWPVIAKTLGYDHFYAEELRTTFNTVIRPFDAFATRAKSQSVSPLSPLPQSSHAKPPGFASVPPSPSAAMRPASRMSGMRESPMTRMGHSAGRPDIQALSESLSPIDDGPLFAPALGAELDTGPSASVRLDSSTPAPSSARISIPGFESRDGTESELSDEELTPLSSAKRHLTPEYQKGEICEVCRGGEQADKIVLCDGCDRGFHIFCLDPPLASVPSTEEWYCTPCLLSQGDDFGFEEGEEHSIPSFQARDAAFSHAWFTKHRPHSHAPPDDLNRTFGKCVVSEDDVEREFWRLTESSTDTVEVEYGADVHSTTHGSAAPTMETFPENEYSRDGWNLNNMPILPESLLRYIKSDISGMTVPWIYLGMLFSAFCWHNEDHYTYSINYMHWGETKTWYGIAGGDADKFEAAIKSEAPELFEAQPGLLFQLVTMMNPGRLNEAGVKVVACDQRPNEFVVTWPKAYHCGFNHGINFNEAVNFALPDWLDEGKESVRRYAEHLKPPVFSHNELLITVSLFADSVKSALWLEPRLRAMIEEETVRRDKLRADVPMLNEILNEEDVPEDQYQCVVCKAFCYLSQVICSCTKAVSCIDHADKLCGCTKGKHSLRKRYSENQLEEILGTISARAAQPQAWRDRLEVLAGVPRPKLKTMRGLVTDGERLAYDMEELDDLRDLVDRAQIWVDKAVAMFTRKSNGRRRKGRQEAETDELDRSVEAFQALYKEVELLAFDAPEILQLRQVMLAIDNFRTSATQIFGTPEDDLDLGECKRVLILGQGVQIEMPEVAQVEQIVRRLEWIHKVNEEVDDRTISLDDVTELIEEAKASGIPSSHPDVLELVSRQQKGQEWVRAVEQLPPAVSIAEIDNIMAVDPLVPLHTPLMDKLEAMRNTMEGWRLAAERMMSGTGTPAVAARLCKDVKAADGLLRKVMMPEVDELQAELDYHDDWLAELRQLLAADPKMKLLEELGYSLKQFKGNLREDDMEPNANYACFCRSARATIMVTCQSCKGEYHPKCVSVNAKNGSGMASFVCDLCLPASEDDRPSLSKLAWLADDHKWNFTFPPVEFATVKAIVDISVPYARYVYQLADPYDQAQSRDFELLAHHARKMFQLAFSLDATNQKTGERIRFEQWIYKRMNDVRIASAAEKDKAPPRVKQKPRTRDPRFVIKEARNRRGDFKCLCEGKPEVSHEGAFEIGCRKCGQHYWSSCVYAMPQDMRRGTSWSCPICRVRSGSEYRREDGTLIAGLKLIDDGHWSEQRGQEVDYAETIRRNRLVHSAQTNGDSSELSGKPVIELHLDRFVPGEERDPNSKDAETTTNGRHEDDVELQRKRKAEGELNGDSERRVLPKLEKPSIHNTVGVTLEPQTEEEMPPVVKPNGYASANGVHSLSNGSYARNVPAGPNVPANYVPILPQMHALANGVSQSRYTPSSTASMHARPFATHATQHAFANGYSPSVAGSAARAEPVANGHSEQPPPVLESRAGIQV